MRNGRALVLVVMLAVQPVCVFGRNMVFPHDPTGEKLYRARLLVDLAPIAIIVCGVLVVCLLLAACRKARHLPPDDAGSYDI